MKLVAGNIDSLKFATKYAEFPIGIYGHMVAAKKAWDLGWCVELKNMHNDGVRFLHEVTMPPWDCELYNYRILLEPREGYYLDPGVSSEADASIDTDEMQNDTTNVKFEVGNREIYMKFNEKAWDPQWCVEVPETNERRSKRNEGINEMSNAKFEVHLHFNITYR